MNDAIPLLPGAPRPTTPTGTMLAEKNADHAGSATARDNSTGAGSPALDSTAGEAVYALRRFLRAFAVARFHDDNVETVPDELIRTAAQLLQEAAATDQSTPDPADAPAGSDGRPITSPARPLTHLTQREKAVSKLVARGLTNREIADELFLSTKTVEYHLTNIYQKLHVKSRWELRRLLDLPR